MEVLKYLQSHGTNVNAAIALNRLPPIAERDELGALQEGEMLFWSYSDHSHSFILSAWQDRKVCTHITTYLPNNVSNLISQRSLRREKRFGKYLASQSIAADDLTSESSQSDGEDEVGHTVPEIVKAYEIYMKGVDHFNQACSYYPYPHRSTRWYRCIVNWLLELALTNSYKLYTSVLGENAVTNLKYRQIIITQWENDFTNQGREESNEGGSFEESKSESLITEEENTRSMSYNSEEEESQSMTVSESNSMEEEVCRLEILRPKNDCDICSDRGQQRSTTVYVCLNPACMISKRRGNPPRFLRVHPECPHIHLRDQS